MTLLSTLTVLALADGVHLIGIAALVFYLGGAQPLLRSALFLAGMMSTHVAGGVLLLVGWSWLGWSPPQWWLAVEWGVVAGLLGLIAMRLRRRSATAAFRPPRSISLSAVVLAGVMVTVADLAFDLPYHLAAARIAAAVPTTGGRLAWLAYFNLVYALPMLAAALAYAVGAPRVRLLVAHRSAGR